jgi:hypothetical protein
MRSVTIHRQRPGERCADVLVRQPGHDGAAPDAAPVLRRSSGGADEKLLEIAHPITLQHLLASSNHHGLRL